jgi:hypothetical protein
VSVKVKDDSETGDSESTGGTARRFLGDEATCPELREASSLRAAATRSKNEQIRVTGPLRTPAGGPALFIMISGPPVTDRDESGRGADCSMLQSSAPASLSSDAPHHVTLKEN